MREHRIFELWHADKYKGDDRVVISELWVPAAMILEEATADQKGQEFVILRQEARHRLKEGKGIRVFSKPEKLKAWLEENGLTLESRQHLITDAGKIAPGFTLQSDGVEFFCHSPLLNMSMEAMNSETLRVLFSMSDSKQARILLITLRSEMPIGKT